MQKSTALLFLLIIFVLSCSKSKQQSKILDAVTILQTKAKQANNDSSLVYLKKADVLLRSLKISADSLRIEQLFLKGYYYQKANLLDSAAYYFHNTLDKIKDTAQGKRNIIYFRNTWNNDYAIDKYTNGLSAANKFIELYKNSNNTKDLLYAYNYFEIIEFRLGNFDKALHYNTKTQEMAQRSKNQHMSVVIGTARANYLYYNGQKNSAYALLDSISNLPQKIAPDSFRQLFLRYGNYKYDDNDFPAAIKAYKAGLSYAKLDLKSTQYDKHIAYLYTNIAEAYTELKTYTLARQFLDSASTHVSKTTDTRLMSSFSKQRISLNYRSGEALNNILADYDSLLLHQDKAYEKRMNEQLLALTSANEKEKVLVQKKQEAEINNLKSTSRFLYLLGFTLLGIILAYFYNLQRKHRFEKQSIYMQQRLLRSQMNPHFISNILYTIQTNLGKDLEASKTYLTKFSRLLRLILENSMQNYVQVEKELESLRKYMDLQLLRFPSKFSYAITLSNLEEDDLIFIPPMLIQPFVENSIEHGFLGIDYSGKIEITLSRHKNLIDCVIEDNGNGLSDGTRQTKQSVSSKLISDFIYKTTKSKISVINKKDHDKGVTGTRTQFLIPYKLTEDD